MHPNTRAGIAYIVAALANGEAGGGVFDFASCKSYKFSGEVNPKYIAILDHERQCHMTGSSEQVFDQGRNTYFSISLSSNHFTGYDYGDSIQFCGDVSDRTVTFNERGNTTRFCFRIL